MSYIRTRLSAGEKILRTLMEIQPQTSNEICSNAEIDKTTFYRNRDLLLNSNLIKEVPYEGAPNALAYALYSYKELEDLFKKLKNRSVTNITIEQLAYLINPPSEKFRKLAKTLEQNTGIKVTFESEPVRRILQKSLKDVF